MFIFGLLRKPVYSVFVLHMLRVLSLVIIYKLDRELIVGTPTLTPEDFRNTVLTALYTIDTEEIPKYDLTQALNLTINSNLVSMMEFDEISGQLSIVVSMDLDWLAEGHPTWDPAASMGGKKSVAISSDKIWTPKLLLLNPAQTVEDLTLSSTRLRLSYDGHVTWKVITAIRASCSVDVTDFPFDTQRCYLDIAPWGYETSEIKIMGDVKKDRSFTTVENSGWELERIAAVGSNLETIPVTRIELNFRRRYQYFLMNVLVPPVLLSFLSPCVFLLPAASGERVSFSVTCFLAFTMFMTLLGSNMPKSSMPVSHLTFFVLYMLIHSCCITFFTIISLRIYNKAGVDPVPRWVQTFIKVVCFRYCRKHKAVDVHRTEVHRLEYRRGTLGRDNSRELREAAPEKTRPWSDEQVSWYTVAKTLDYFCFFTFFGWMLFCVLTTLATLTGF